MTTMNDKRDRKTDIEKGERERRRERERLKERERDKERSSDLRIYIYIYIYIILCHGRCYFHLCYFSFPCQNILAVSLRDLS